MDFRIIISGTRTFEDYDLVEKTLDPYIRKIPPYEKILFISGCAKGADQLGERYANSHAYRIYHLPADWHLYGKAAGPVRNEQMAYAATWHGAYGVLFAFWDGKSRGTASMIKYAKKYNLEIHVIEIPS